MVGLSSLCSAHGDPHLFVSGKSSCRENRMKTHRTHSSSAFDYLESNASMNDLVVEAGLALRKPTRKASPTEEYINM